MNTDQGSQYTSKLWREAVETYGIQSSMDGKGRWADNVYIERVWRTIKQENVFLQKFQTVREAKRKIADFIDFYNTRRLHQNLQYNTPNEVYNGYAKVDKFIYVRLTSASSDLSTVV